MRVIQSCSSTSWTDSEIQTLKTALGMKTKHFDVILVCTKGSVLEREGIKHHLVVRSYFESEGKAIRTVKRIQSLLKYFPVDVIHTHCPRDIRILVSAMQMAKSSARFFLTMRMTGGIKKRDLLHRYFYSRLDRIFAVSSYIQQHVINTCPVPKKKVGVLHDGIDLDPLNHNDNHKWEIRQELGLSRDSIVIGMAGQLNGYSECLLAAKTITEKVDKRVAFIVVGCLDSGEKGHCDQRVNLSNKTCLDKNIIFTEFGSDTSRIMKTMDILVFPSHVEPLGNMLLEAMAMEIPIVAGSGGSVPEIVFDQETGLLVPPRQVGALTDALIQYIRNPALRRHHAKAARRQIQLKFSFQDYLEALITSYTS